MVDAPYLVLQVGRIERLCDQRLWECVGAELMRSRR